MGHWISANFSDVIRETAALAETYIFQQMGIIQLATLKAERIVSSAFIKGFLEGFLPSSIVIRSSQ